MTFRGHVVLQFNIHKDGTITDVAVVRPSEIDAFNRAAFNAILGSNPTEPLPPEYPDDKCVLHGHVLLQRTTAFALTTKGDADADAAARTPHPARRARRLRVHSRALSSKPSLVLAVLGPTASGKSALGLALAERFGGEIINCDSTAVYRGFDIGTDKVPLDERRGIPHHLIDIADPTEVYTAAQFARDAARVIRDIHARGKLPILVGGTGFYYRALTRGLFPGPGRRRGAARAARADRGRAGARAPAPDAAARRSRLGRPHHAARSQAPGPRARGVLRHRPAADRALRRHALADCRLRGHRRRAATAALT